MGGQNTVICMKLFPRPPSSLNLIFLCLLTAVECGKGLLGRKVMIFVFLHLCFLSPISPQNSSARFLAFSSQKSGRNFSYEPKAKLVPVTGLIWRRPQKNIRTKYIKRYHHYQCQIKGWPNKTINKACWERLFTLTDILLYFTPRNITGTSLVTLSKHV